MHPLLVRALLGAATCLPACAFAQDFSWQFSGSAEMATAAGSLDHEVDSNGLGATYFFRPVDEQVGPYALAPFLDRSSRITATYSEDTATTVVPVASLRGAPPPPSPFSTIVNRAQSASVSGRYVWRESGWYAGGALLSASSDDRLSLPASLSLNNDEVRGYGATVGRYLGRATTLELSFDAIEAELEFETLYCVSPLPSCVLGRTRQLYEANTESVSLAAFHVGAVGRMRYALSGGVVSSQTNTAVRILSTDEAIGYLPWTPISSGQVVSTTFLPTAPLDRRERYAIGAEFFPTKALGIGLDYARTDGDQPRDETYDLSATWFFRRNIAVQATIGRTKSDGRFALDREVDTAGLRLIGRL